MFLSLDGVDGRNRDEQRSGNEFRQTGRCHGTDSKVNTALCLPCVIAMSRKVNAARSCPNIESSFYRVVFFSFYRVSNMTGRSFAGAAPSVIESIAAPLRLNFLTCFTGKN